ncbi:CGNR zinc finger domain-containing protein [Actinacidiphila acididurans]|uniref:CGNR zinc finger domain-containing protein n=1 Tax=Actinacidiphila acididurans TaxID=2784346 RepID=A0ABS2TVM4_9ACTN|nr:CGNR zinc finger domain-containing protein [Actinacidiphila acididurans]MBM9507392.1 CGNR zinc finger domain-containing protein [Actinacidiphila acididurans]
MRVDHFSLTLALALATTIRHDGQDGITDEIASPAGLDAWVRAHEGELAEAGFAVPSGFTADGGVLAAVVEIRTAVRALFARAVLPGEPSSADAGRLPPAGLALERLNAASAFVPVAPLLDWPPDAAPTVLLAPAPGALPPARLLAAALARAAVAFLAGPDRALLRACPAPRCVRYFVKEHPRQEWCKPSCGNRARVARHHARRSSRLDPTDSARP